jgi:hypothetical protein
MNNKYLINALEDTEGFYNDNIIKSSYTYNGYVVPRVTEILSKCIHSDSLMYWANSLGFKHKSYKQTLSMYAGWGTDCHNHIDQFIESDFTDRETPDSIQATNAFDSYLFWYDDISMTNNVYVKMHEQPITCRFFGGTLDGLYEINGKLYLIDYKTSNHITFKYALQLAAYRYILRTEYNIEIDGCLILKLSKSDVSYEEFYLDLSREDHLEYIDECEHAFLSLVYSYYNILKVESGFEDIMKGEGL